MSTPLAIGTRGTIGSLVRKEIEYFNKLDLDRVSYTSKIHQEPRDSKTSTKTSSIGSFLRMSWRKKKTKAKRSNNIGGSFLPRMCSAVDVNEGNSRFDRIPGFTYRSLKVEVENL